MAELLSKPRESNEGTPHCPYCRDTVDEGVIVQCDQCQTRYHAECATSCVILGCTGSLKDANSKPLSKLTIRERDLAAKNEAAHGDKRNPQDISAMVILGVFFGLFSTGMLFIMGEDLGGVFAPILFLVVFGLLIVMTRAPYSDTTKKDPGDDPPSKSSP